MSVYVIVDVGLKDANDTAAFREYAEATDKLLNQAGVKVIGFDPAPKVLEGDWLPRTVVIQEYPDMATVERVQRSDAYAPLKRLRHRIADTNVIVVHGTQVSE